MGTRDGAQNGAWLALLLMLLGLAACQGAFVVTAPPDDNNGWAINDHGHPGG